jgi:hypothetical protein
MIYRVHALTPPVAFTSRMSVTKFCERYPDPATRPIYYNSESSARKAAKQEFAKQYNDAGYIGRTAYLISLMSKYPPQAVSIFAQILGPAEDFDGLILLLEAYGRG